MGLMRLLKRIVVSPMTALALCVIVLCVVNVVVANDGPKSNDIHIIHSESLHAPSVPNGEKERNNELLPWYTDFIQLPADGTSLFSDMSICY